MKPQRDGRVRCSAWLGGGNVCINCKWFKRREDRAHKGVCLHGPPGVLAAHEAGVKWGDSRCDSDFMPSVRDGRKHWCSKFVALTPPNDQDDERQEERRQ